MDTCPSCGNEMPTAGRACERCGSATDRSESSEAADSQTSDSRVHLRHSLADEGTGLDSRRLHEGDLVAGRYQIGRLVGRGGWSSIYQAVDTKLGEQVALKIADSRLVSNELAAQRFRQEVSIARNLSHPGFVRIYDVVEDAERDFEFLVMELLEGRTLRSELARRAAGQAACLFPVWEALGIVAGLLEALRAAHPEVIHRDLKPENIVLGPDGSTKILDFGVARFEGTGRLTLDQATLGTLGYMAPEQRGDPSSADHRADLYSVGAILYELLTGRLPEGLFRMPSQLRSDVGREVDVLIHRTLQQDPGNRFSTADEFLQSIELVLATHPAPTAKPGGGDSEKRGGMRRRDAKKILREAHARKLLSREQAELAWSQFMHQRKDRPETTVDDAVRALGLVEPQRWDAFRDALLLESGIEKSDQHLLIESDSRRASGPESESGRRRLIVVEERPTERSERRPRKAGGRARYRRTSRRRKPLSRETRVVLIAGGIIGLALFVFMVAALVREPEVPVAQQDPTGEARRGEPLEDPPQPSNGRDDDEVVRQKPDPWGEGDRPRQRPDEPAPDPKPEDVPRKEPQVPDWLRRALAQLDETHQAGEFQQALTEAEALRRQCEEHGHAETAADLAGTTASIRKDWQRWSEAVVTRIEEALEPDRLVVAGVLLTAVSQRPVYPSVHGDLAALQDRYLQLADGQIRAHREVVEATEKRRQRALRPHANRLDRRVNAWYLARKTLRCSSCDRSSFTVACSKCSGSGRTVIVVPQRGRIVKRYQTCSRCRGDGRLSCPNCVKGTVKSAFSRVFWDIFSRRFQREATRQAGTMQDFVNALYQRLAGDLETESWAAVEDVIRWLPGAECRKFHVDNREIEGSRATVRVEVLDFDDGPEKLEESVWFLEEDDSWYPLTRYDVERAPVPPPEEYVDELSELSLEKLRLSSPTRLRTTEGLMSHGSTPYLTPNGLSLYFATDGAAGTHADIHVADRPGLLEEFGPDRPVKRVNSEAPEWSPSLTANGRELYFLRGTPTGVWVSRRTSWHDDWADPEPLTHDVLAGVADLEAARIAPDGLSLLLVVANTPGAPTDLWVSIRKDPDSDFGTPRPLAPELNEPTANEGGPCLSADGRTLLFTSDRQAGRGGPHDLFVARRPGVAEPFGEPIACTRVTELFSNGAGYRDPWFFSGTVLFTFGIELRVTERGPLVRPPAGVWHSTVLLDE